MALVRRVMFATAAVSSKAGSNGSGAMCPIVLGMPSTPSAARARPPKVRWSTNRTSLPPSAKQAELSWSYQRKDGKLFVSATNSGGRRIRVADIVVDDGKGKPVTVAKGLAGYVLARSSKSWVAPNTLNAGASSLQISAQGDSGPINAQAKSLAAR